MFCIQWRSSSQFEPDLNCDVIRFTSVHRKKTLLSTVHWPELHCRRILHHCADSHARVWSEVGKPCPLPGEQLLQQQGKKRKRKISLVWWLLFFQSQTVETYPPGPEPLLKVAASCCLGSSVPLWRTLMPVCPPIYVVFLAHGLIVSSSVCHHYQLSCKLLTLSETLQHDCLSLRSPQSCTPWTFPSQTRRTFLHSANICFF